MPRHGSVVDDSVWRVPKLTSLSTVALRLPAFICLSIAPNRLASMAPAHPHLGTLTVSHIEKPRRGGASP
jgi:hypothetical protein